MWVGESLCIPVKFGQPRIDHPVGIYVSIRLFQEIVS
jgi:hypothetical protein